MTSPEPGWPFLIAPGRHRDYSIILAPDFLMGDLDYGFLDETVKPGTERPVVVNVRSATGRHLTVVSATHTLTATDAALTHDEFGRPMRLLYGFVCRRPLAEPAPADLAASLSAALDAYKWFLENEDAPVTVAAAQPFALRSAMTVSTRAPKHVVDPAARRRTRKGFLSVGIAVAALLAGLALAVWLRPPAVAPQPCPSALATASPGQPATTATPCAIRDSAALPRGRPVAAR